jgi:hypothetical protein
MAEKQGQLGSDVACRGYFRANLTRQDNFVQFCRRFERIGCGQSSKGSESGVGNLKIKMVRVDLYRKGNGHGTAC